MRYLLFFLVLICSNIAMAMTELKLEHYNDCLWDNKKIILSEQQGVLRRVNNFFYKKYLYYPIEEAEKRDLPLECFLLYAVYSNQQKFVINLLAKEVPQRLLFLSSCCNHRFEKLSCSAVARHTGHNMLTFLVDDDLNRESDVNIDLCITSCIGDIK